MAKQKYYAVKVGSAPGIYLSWAEAEPLVKGFPGAKYKSFPTREEAEAFLKTGTSATITTKSKTTSTTPIPVAQTTFDFIESSDSQTNTHTGEYSLPYAFVDGSFNPATKVYGCGGFLYDLDGNRHLIQDSSDDEEMATMRNVAGEILGSTLAIKKAIELGLKELTIYYDYEGIRHWAEGTWKRNKEGTIRYHEFVSAIRSSIKLNFVHVKAHTGIPGNEEADTLAKEAVGIE
ncbi:MAG: ribonuclease H family protein [Lachnospiraceae bacterium]|nr:ribonuclease H family protein [Lachnospiraceae bacterium]